MAVSNRLRGRGVAGFAALVLAAALLTAAPATHARAEAGVTVSRDRAARTVTMSGARYRLVFDYAKQARVGSLRVDGTETLDPAQGIYSAVDSTTSAALAADPSVDVDRTTVVAHFALGDVADETWTLVAGPTGVRFTLARTYRAATTVTQQGTPLMTFAQDAFDQMRWTGDGGNYPLGGKLLDANQNTWLATGKYFDPKIRAAKEQVDYTLLDGTHRHALRIAGGTNHDDLDRGRATEVYRTQQPAGQDLRLGVVTAAAGLRYATGSSLGYSTDHGDGHVRDDGGPVYQPVAVDAGERDVVSLDLAPADYDSYYDLGTLRGVDEAQLAKAIGDYGRWMMQDTKRGASTEASVFKTEVPPIEMQWLGQLLELFPEKGAVSAYESGLQDIRDHLVDTTTGKIRCCRPLTGVYWGVDYSDQASGYTLGVTEAYRLSGDAHWTAGMKKSVEGGLDYSLAHYVDPATGLVRNIDPTLTRTGYNNDYWESSTGTYDGYGSALLYDALTSWSRIEGGVLGDTGAAASYRAAADRLKASFNKDAADGGLWSPASHTFLYGSGNADALYLPVNAEVLKTDLANDDRKREIVAAVEAQDAAGNYDMHPMNVRDLFTPGTNAPSGSKISENGGWYGAPDGDYYAGLPLTGDPRLLQRYIASFLTRYQADGFYGNSAWGRTNWTARAGAELWFPTTVMPAWGLYRYGYGFQPADDRLVLAPFIAPGMTGSTVKYTWRGTPLRVTYRSRTSFAVTAQGRLSTPVEVRWIDQRPDASVHVRVDGATVEREVDPSGVASAVLPADTTGRHELTCVDCVADDQAGGDGSRSLVTLVIPGEATPRNDVYQQVGTRVQVGDRPLSVTGLGRYKLSGNHQVHTLKVLDANGSIVAAAAVDMTDRPDAQGFVRADLSHPVRLGPHRTYYLYSSEAPGGDTWYDFATRATTTPDATLAGAAYGRELTKLGGQGNGYGPLTLYYTVG